MEHLRIILDTIEGLAIPEGDYLTIANALKKVNEALPQQQPQQPQSITLLSLNMERIGKYFLPQYIITHKLYFDHEHLAILIEDIESGVETVEVNIYIIKTLINGLKDQYKEMFLRSNNKNAKSYRQYILDKANIWKKRVIEYSKQKYMDAESVKNFSDKKRHILKVDIVNDTTDTIYIATDKIVLGRNINIVREIRAYEVNQKLKNNTPLSFWDAYSMSEGWWNFRPPTLITSGITHNTKDKRRTYTYMDNITITYISKLNTGEEE